MSHLNSRKSDQLFSTAETKWVLFYLLSTSIVTLFFYLFFYQAIS